MKRTEIENILPHRGIMLLVDDILELEPERTVTGYKRLRPDEAWVDGHFPGDPVFPGAWQIELMAQTALFLFYRPGETREIRPMLAKVESVKFLAPAVPGEELYVKVNLLMKAGAYIKAEAVICKDAAGRERVARGKLTCYLEREGRDQNE